MSFDHEPLRVGLIGCGGMGMRHAKAVAEMHALANRAVQIVAICDTDANRRAAIAALIEVQCGVRPQEFSHLADLLDRPEVEAVDIVLPTSLHQTTVLSALDAGKHVLVEKPLALTVSACDLIVDAASRSNRIVAVAENYRRIPHNRAMGALFRSGTLGQLNTLFVRNFASPEPPVSPGHQPVNSPGWYRDRKHAGGYHALEIGVHEADIQQYWFGPIESVSAEMQVFDSNARLDPDVSEDMLTASLRFSSGLVSNLSFCSTMRGFEVADRLLVTSNAVVTSGSWHAWQNGEIRFEDGSARATEDAVAEWVAALSPHDREMYLPSGAWSTVDQGSQATEPLSYGVGIAIHDFARAARTGRQPEVTAEIARAAVATCCAIWESAHLHAPVRVDQVLAGKLREAQSPMNEALGLAA